jgi:hypothetical protein
MHILKLCLVMQTSTSNSCMINKTGIWNQFINFIWKVEALEFSHLFIYVTFFTLLHQILSFAYCSYDP